MDIDPEFKYSRGNRGWTGDVSKMRLSIEKLRNLGWKIKIKSTATVRQATKEINEEMK